MRRFYEAADVEHTERGFVIALDGKPIMTPGQRPLAVPTQALAAAIVAEWQAQSDEILPDTMPLTRLVNSALDRVAPERAATLAEVARYAETDLLCHRAGEVEELTTRQERGWQPLLDWLAKRFGARLVVTTGVIPAAQPAAALAAVRAAAAEFDDFKLTALHAATAACGSVVIGLALAHGRIDGEAAWTLSLLDELYQAERWGDDEEARQRRRHLQAEIGAAATLLAMCGGGP